VLGDAWDVEELEPHAAAKRATTATEVTAYLLSERFGLRA
jgi:hypothetical protein